MPVSSRLFGRGGPPPSDDWQAHYFGPPVRGRGFPTVPIRDHCSNGSRRSSPWSRTTGQLTHGFLLRWRWEVATTPEPEIPNRWSARALDIARELDDPDVIADALLGRILLFSGVALHSAESMRLLRELFELPHQQSRVDSVVAHAVASMTEMNLANVDAAVKHVRQGIIGCELLRLPVVRVQLRWMEATLAEWYGDFAQARRQYETARQIHLQTELYTAGSADLAFNTLEWERGALAESDPGVVEPDSWTIAIDAARGEREATSEGIKKWLINRGPQTWTTLGHQTLLARVVADLELVDYADTFIGLLSPYTGCIATVGPCR